MGELKIATSGSRIQSMGGEGERARERKEEEEKKETKKKNTAVAQLAQQHRTGARSVTASGGAMLLAVHVGSVEATGERDFGSL